MTPIPSYYLIYRHPEMPESTAVQKNLTDHCAVLTKITKYKRKPRKEDAPAESDCLSSIAYVFKKVAELEGINGVRFGTLEQIGNMARTLVSWGWEPMKVAIPLTAEESTASVDSTNHSDMSESLTHSDSLDSLSAESDSKPHRSVPVTTLRAGDFIFLTKPTSSRLVTHAAISISSTHVFHNSRHPTPDKKYGRIESISKLFATYVPSSTGRITPMEQNTDPRPTLARRTPPSKGAVVPLPESEALPSHLPVLSAIDLLQLPVVRHNIENRSPKNANSDSIPTSDSDTDPDSDLSAIDSLQQPVVRHNSENRNQKNVSSNSIPTSDSDPDPDPDSGTSPMPMTNSPLLGSLLVPSALKRGSAFKPYVKSSASAVSSISATPTSSSAGSSNNSPSSTARDKSSPHFLPLGE